MKDDHIFEADGKKMLYEGWMYFYKPYRSDIGTDLPVLHEGDILRNVAITMDERFTQPPPRFNQASLLEEMERERIGTKAKRLSAHSLKEIILLVLLPIVMGEEESRPRKSDLK